MKSELFIRKREDGNWLVLDVKTHLDKPIVGTVLTSSDLQVMNQASTWVIHKIPHFVSIGSDD